MWTRCGPPASRSSAPLRTCQACGSRRWRRTRGAPSWCSSRIRTRSGFITSSCACRIRTQTLRWYVRAFGGDRTKYKGVIDAVRYRDLGVFYLFAVKDAGAAPSPGHSIDHLGFGPIDLDKVVNALTAEGAKFTSNPNPRINPACRFVQAEERRRHSPALLRGTRSTGAPRRLPGRARRRAHGARAAPRGRRTLGSHKCKSQKAKVKGKSVDFL